MINKRGAASAPSKRGAASGRNGEHYVPGSRRQRTCKEKVASVGDYIRTVMQQLQSGTQVCSLAPGADHSAGISDVNAFDSVSRMQLQTATVASTPLKSLRPARAARTNPSSASSSSEQQVWLMIVERMREEIIKARDVHRADLYCSKGNKKGRFSSHSHGNLQEQKKSSEAATHPYCTICTPQQRPATAITVCGHYLCWACLCKWHHKDATSSLTVSKKECPCCKKILTKSQVTFVGEKVEEDLACDPSCQSSSILSLATDQRDKLLQAAAIPILSSRLQGNMDVLCGYKPALINAGSNESNEGVVTNMVRLNPPDDSLYTPSSLVTYNSLENLYGMEGQVCSHDYISTVTQQLQSGTQACKQLLQSAPSDVAPSAMYGTHTNQLAATSTTTSSSIMHPRSEQTIWLEIVKSMQTKIHRARDEDRIDLLLHDQSGQTSHIKRRRFDSDSSHALLSQVEVHKNMIESCKSTQCYCTVCGPNNVSLAKVRTICGHHLCWDCIWKWHEKDRSSIKECPCCQRVLSNSEVICISEDGSVTNEDGTGDCIESSASLALASDQRDCKLLQAAAIPVVSSYALMVESAHMSSPVCAGSGSDISTTGHELVDQYSMSSSNLQVDSPGSSYIPSMSIGTSNTLDQDQYNIGLGGRTNMEDHLWCLINDYNAKDATLTDMIGMSTMSSHNICLTALPEDVSGTAGIITNDKSNIACKIGPDDQQFVVDGVMNNEAGATFNHSGAYHTTADYSYNELLPIILSQAPAATITYERCSGSCAGSIYPNESEENNKAAIQNGPAMQCLNDGGDGNLQNLNQRSSFHLCENAGTNGELYQEFGGSNMERYTFMQKVLPEIEATSIDAELYADLAGWPYCPEQQDSHGQPSNLNSLNSTNVVASSDSNLIDGSRTYTSSSCFHQ